MRIFLFDIDGTLVNTGGAGGAALRKAFQTAFGISEPGKVPFSGRTDRGIIGSLFRLHEIEDCEKNWQQVLQRYLEELPQELESRDGRVLPGVESLLSELTHMPNCLLGLLTGNMQRGAEIKLSFYGLDKHFPFGGFGDHHHDRDDVAHAARSAASDHHGQPVGDNQVWVIGDTPLDVKCARAIQARCLAVATGVDSREELAASQPDHLLPDLNDTSRVLEILTG